MDFRKSSKISWDAGRILPITIPCHPLATITYHQIIAIGITNEIIEQLRVFRWAGGGLARVREDPDGGAARVRCE